MDEEEAIDRVVSGDTEAFRYFLTHYKHIAFNVSVAIMKDEHYAEEVVQDAFMKAFNGLKSFKRNSKFKTWFYRIVVNESLQHLKKLKKHAILVDTDEILEGVIEDNACEEHSIISEDLKLIMDTLPSNERLALNLFYLDESSLKEVAEITGWTLANTKIILHRARKRIRSRFEGEIKL
jgi:RNA polymerase sigma-70 factor (ECF subfamily)